MHATPGPSERPMPRGRDILLAAARLSGGPVHPGTRTKQLTITMEFGIRGGAGIRGARPRFLRPDYVDGIVFNRMRDWADRRGLMHRRATGAWDFPVPSLPAAAPLWRPLMGPDGNCVLPTLENPLPGILPSPSTQAAAPVALALPTRSAPDGSGRRADAAVKRERWILDYNADRYRVDGTKKHLIALPLGPSLRPALPIQQRASYIPLFCRECPARTVVKGKKRFCTSVCGASPPYIHPFMASQD